MPPKIENPSIDRVRYQLSVSGIKDLKANPLRSGVHNRGYLPHVKNEGAEYFLTFRLADSLPQEVLLRYENERAERIRLIEQARKADHDPVNDEEAIDRDFRRKVERYLDQGAGACHLRRPDVAELVSQALKFFHEQRYLLHEWLSCRTTSTHCAGRYQTIW